MTVLSKIGNWIWEAVGRFAVEPIKPKIMLIAPEQLAEVTDTLNSTRTAEMTALLNELCPKYSITGQAFQFFLANLLQESGEFAHKSENMSYRAERIVQVWPTRFKDVAAAAPFAKNPIALSNKVYGGRMGNTMPNDGYDYRGMAFIGVTGRELAQKYADYIGKPIKETADLVRSDDKAALDCSCWFYAIYKHLLTVTDFKQVCSLINTGTINRPAIGYDVRLKYYNRILALK